MGFFFKAKKIDSGRRTGGFFTGGFGSKSGGKVDVSFFAYIEDLNKPKGGSKRYSPPKKKYKPRPQRRKKYGG